MEKFSWVPPRFEMLTLNYLLIIPRKMWQVWVRIKIDTGICGEIWRKGTTWKI